MLFVKIDASDLILNMHHVVRMSARGEHETVVLLSVGKPDSMTLPVPFSKFIDLLGSASDKIEFKSMGRTVAQSSASGEDTTTEEGAA